MKKHLCGIHLLAALICLMPVKAQVPETHLYLFQLTQDDTLRWHIHSPSLLSDWNPGGYTNQPEWIDNTTLLVSALRTGDPQNEIYKLDLRDQVLQKMTETPASEFSPLLMPDKKHFSVVTQVLGGAINQQLYEYPLDLSSAGHALLPDVLNVGYHCWLTEDELALFLVEEPVKLALASLSDGSPRIYSSAIGRCLKRTASGHVAYVHKYSDTFWFLKTMNPETRKSEIVFESLYGKEDFTISVSGAYFMGSGSTLYVFDPLAKVKKWIPVFDLAVFGIENITRISINAQNMLALVNQKGE